VRKKIEISHKSESDGNDVSSRAIRSLAYGAKNGAGFITATATALPPSLARPYFIRRLRFAPAACPGDNGVFPIGKNYLHFYRKISIVTLLWNKAFLNPRFLLS